MSDPEQLARLVEIYDPETAVESAAQAVLVTLLDSTVNVYTHRDDAVVVTPWIGCRLALGSGDAPYYHRDANGAKMPSTWDGELQFTIATSRAANAAAHRTVRAFLRLVCRDPVSINGRLSLHEILHISPSSLGTEIAADSGVDMSTISYRIKLGVKRTSWPANGVVEAAPDGDSLLTEDLRRILTEDGREITTEG